MLGERSQSDQQRRARLPKRKQSERRSWRAETNLGMPRWRGETEEKFVKRAEEEMSERETSSRPWVSRRGRRTSGTARKTSGGKTKECKSFSRKGSDGELYEHQRPNKTCDASSSFNASDLSSTLYIEQPSCGRRKHKIHELRGLEALPSWRCFEAREERRRRSFRYLLAFTKSSCRATVLSERLNISIYLFATRLEINSNQRKPHSSFRKDASRRLSSLSGFFLVSPNERVA